MKSRHKKMLFVILFVVSALALVHPMVGVVAACASMVGMSFMLSTKEPQRQKIELRTRNKRGQRDH